MKKTKILYASAIAMACAFGMQSCTQEDNPSIHIDPAKNVYVYDFAAAFNVGENPANFNGNQNNGQGFYGWEKEDKTDSKRNDYKGYAWAEGSVLPEICHVWRRIDRINGNIKEGGLYCPNDREMAIDGLQEGSTVQIFYVAPEKTSITSLKDIPFGNWSDWVGGELTNPWEPAWHEGVADGQPYGDGSVNAYADLSAYAKLVVVTTEGAPRFLFNRDVNEGQWSENEAESHLIDNTKGGWSANTSPLRKLRVARSGLLTWLRWLPTRVMLTCTPSRVLTGQTAMLQAWWLKDSHIWRICSGLLVMVLQRVLAFVPLLTSKASMPYWFLA